MMYSVRCMVYEAMEMDLHHDALLLLLALGLVVIHSDPDIPGTQGGTQRGTAVVSRLGVN